MAAAQRPEVATDPGRTGEADLVDQSLVERGLNPSEGGRPVSQDHLQHHGLNPAPYVHQLEWFFRHRLNRCCFGGDGPR